MAAPRLPLNNGMTLPFVGLGTWQSSDSEVEKAVKHAIDVGYRLIDTARLYGNEAAVGRAVQDKVKECVISRDEVIVTTKLWNTHHSIQDVVPVCRQSLQNLGLEHIDLYLVHWPFGLKSSCPPQIPQPYESFDLTSIEDTWHEMERCVELGLVTSIGVSNFNVHQVQTVLDCGSIKPVVNQDEPLMPKTLQEKDVSPEPCGRGSVRMASTLQKELNSHSTSKMRPQPRQTSPTKNKFKKSMKPTRFEANINKLEKIATLATTDPDDEYEKYGRHIAAQLRAMPLRSFILLQREINNLISTERLHLIDSGSPSNIFTTEIQRPNSSSTHSSMSFEPMETNINTDTQYQLSDECGDLLNKALIGICSPTSNDSM